MFDTKHYTVQQLADDPEEFCWGVINKEYGSIEHKSYTLPSAILVCQSLSDQLEELIPSSQVRPINETIN